MHRVQNISIPKIVGIVFLNKRGQCLWQVSRRKTINYLEENSKLAYACYAFPAENPNQDRRGVFQCYRALLRQ